MDPKLEKQPQEKKRKIRCCKFKMDPMSAFSFSCGPGALGAASEPSSVSPSVLRGSVTAPDVSRNPHVSVLTKGIS